MRIAHISDIHIRLKDRHDEYREVFSRLYEELKKQNPDRILINGDIVHSKTTLSPELVSLATSFIYNLSLISPVDIIAGNHDMNMSNMNRMDSLTPIVESARSGRNNCEINYYTKTGFYNIGKNFIYGVYSLLDGGDIHLTKKEKNPDFTYIALYHGLVSGCKLDNDYVMSDSSTTMSTFDNFDFVMLGDIHKRQFLNDDMTAAYAGSLIQQNYSEDIEKGFLMWDIRNNKDFECKFIPVYNDYAFATIYASSGDLPDLILPPKTNIRVIWETKSKDISKLESSRLNSVIREKYKPLSIQLMFKPTDNIIEEKIGDSKNISNENVQRDLLRQWLEKLEERVDIEKILEIDKIVTESVSTNEFEDFSNSNWHLKKLYIENFMSYEEVEIDFDRMRGIIGLFGTNAVGKSVIIDSILYALFNKTTREVKNEELVNKNTNNDVCTVRLQLEIGDVDYEITRWTSRQFQKTSGKFINARTDVTFKRKYKFDEEWENLTETQRNDTEKIIRNAIGNFDDFMITTLSTQGGTSEFLKLKNSPRVDLILRFLGLDIFNKKYEYAKTILKQIDHDIKKNNKGIELELLDIKKSEMENASENIEEIRTSIFNLNSEIESLRTKISEYNKLINKTIKIDRNVETISSEIDFVKSEMKALDLELTEKKSLIDEITQKITELETDFLLSDEKFDELLKLKAIADYTSNELKSKRSNLETNNRILKIYEKDLKNGNGCPVSDDLRHKSCQFLCGYIKKEDEYNSLIKLNSILQSEILELDGELLKINSVYKKIDDQNLIRDHLGKARNKIEILKKDVETILSRKEAKTVSLKLLKSQMKIAKENDETIKNNLEYKEKIENSNKVLTSKILLLDNINLEREELGNKLIVIKKEISDIELTIEKIAADEKKYRLMNVYCDAMHRTGLPIDILKSYIPKINYEINNVLGKIVNFEVYLEVGEDGTDIDVKMKYNDFDDDRPAIMGCGMEKMLMNMSIRYALLSISNLNISSSWYIDEGFGTLSSENIVLMRSFFENIKKKFRNIVIITHLDELKDIADHPIYIENINRISKLTFQTQ